MHGASLDIANAQVGPNETFVVEMIIILLSSRLRDRGPTGFDVPNVSSTTTVDIFSGPAL